MNSGRISKNNVKYNLINLSQLVFEVTDDCNLNCYYCAYGDLYNGYDFRTAKYLKLKDVKLLIDFLAGLWKKSMTDAQIPVTTIGFYGGEPLLNMKFIMDVIEYIESLHLPRTIEYSMTSNAVLMDRYMSFLVEKNFHLLISLDGDKEAHAYRVDKAGHNSFDRIIANIRILRDKFPLYFKNNVNFNSVLHNKNSVAGIANYIYNTFGKKPQISELSDIGIRECKIDKFRNIYQDKLESFKQSNSLTENSEAIFIDNPMTHNVMTYLQRQSQNVFKYYSDLFSDSNQINYTPTGTCMPFSKKMFITVNGKILQCEKIHHNFSLGIINENNLELNLEVISEKYNEFLNKMQPFCSACYNKDSCLQCLFHIDNIELIKPNCKSFMTKSDYNRYQSNCLNYIKGKQGLYRELITEVIED